MKKFKITACSECRTTVNYYVQEIKAVDEKQARDIYNSYNYCHNIIRVEETEG